MTQGEKCKRRSNEGDDGKSPHRVEKSLVVVDEGTPKRRKQPIYGDDGVIIFNEEELKTIQGFKRGIDYIEVGCGTTNRRYGDFIGMLRIDDKGQFLITCQCCPECTLENITPEEFEKHAGKEGSGRWKSSIWVHEREEDKVPLSKTPLLQYYTYRANVSNWKDVANRKRNCHRDEFIRCSSCNKERRFRFRNRPEIQVYHVAVNNKSWTCSDWPYQKITCDHEEERPSLRACRGCPRASFCQGCSSCYCRGCIKCRFEDCSCQECRDFMLLAEP